MSNTSSRVRIRTQAQLAAWRSLTSNQRRLIVSHRPNELEKEISLRASIMTALENVYGRREWPVSTACIAEGEPEPGGPKEAYFAMTYREIGDELGVGVERVRQIEMQALRKLRQVCHRFHLYELMSGDPPTPSSTSGDIEAALARALCAPEEE